MKRLCCALLVFLSWIYATPKDTLIVAVENEPSRINPVFSEDHDVAIGVVFSGLVRLNEKMEILPDLAKQWSVSADGLVYEFELRDGVKWHDGQPFGVDDVIFTLQSLKNPKINSPLRVNFEMIEKIEKLDEKKLRITLSKPFPAFLDVMSVGILPKHLLEGKDLNQTSFNSSPIGTGPYRLKQWKKGQYISLEANPFFYLGRVETPKLVLKIIANPSISAIELKNGSIDVGLVDFEIASSFAKDSRFKLVFLSSADYRALMFNLKNPLLKDPKVRIALNYAINKEAMVKTLINSHGFVAHHPLQVSWANPLAYPTYSYDPKKALKLLEDLGWKMGQNKILQKDGKNFEFEIYAMNNDPLRVALASVLQSELAKIGIRTKVVVKPSGSFDYTQVDSFLVGWGSPVDPDLHTYRVFAGSEDTDLNQEGWNFGHYQNPQVDRSLSLARSTLDLSERKKSYADFIEALYQDPPYIFLMYLNFPLVYKSEIKGIIPNIVGHHGVGFTWNIWQWRK
ncbi:ABC transporter substrate-binding protein [Helicobacter kayseriensis]|uniref:ABC transporter substrate-binding protein n=1 Tax=Helicobacter kayseriensis TaxID=2905877 RepID=UPI001E536C2A|nr:ABC transporter substrate-binding protein [Helicobacter kayseriensis]MCE3047734.1 ABC transporter substrate-binding protein [Helicobacter kayseriensis]MCE3049115.1 ABC transporter substrate-binding protein [Helicobacter kayseriensis]